MSVPEVAVVTGASSGIGRSTALRLAVLGYRLTLVGRDQQRLDGTVQAIEHSGSTPEILILPADVSDPAQAASVVALTLEQWDRIDVLVNNAGAVESVPLADTDEDLLYRTFAINTFGPAVLIARAWNPMIERGSGCIVNVSSMATVDPLPGLGAYAASKCALESLTRSIHAEGGARGLRAFSVAPGAVETPMLRGLFSTEQLPRERTLAPADVAEVIVECIRGERDEQVGRTILLSAL